MRLVAVFTGGHTGMFPEGAVKIGNIGKAHKIRDFVDADPGSD